MKKIINRIKGFTLIEVIVALIIIGILVVIAAPYTFRWIASGRGSKAIMTMNSYKLDLEACLALHSDQNPTPTGTVCNLAGQNLATSINGWDFEISTGNAVQLPLTGRRVGPLGTFGGGDLTYTLVATEGSATITLTRETNGTWTCSAGTDSPFTGVCF